MDDRREGGAQELRQKGGFYGIGYLLATAVFALGYSKGCRKAEILAINDNGKFCRLFSSCIACILMNTSGNQVLELQLALVVCSCLTV